MKIQFLKDHVGGYKKGDVVDNHANASYLIILGVAAEVKEEPKKTKKKSD